ncbi:MAG: 50S ribosomal protein L20 [Spirochaetes bacterium]|nr:50S ribosomal protein L20 [Spirochaetota bacterium]
MSRVKNSVATRKRRKKILKQAKGFWGRKSKLFKTAKEAVMRALRYAYRDRRARKRNFRSLWIARINAACRNRNISYSKFIAGMKKANIILNRKILAYIAVEDAASFDKIADEARNAIEPKKS